MFVDGPSKHVRNEKNWIGTLCLNEWADRRPSRPELIAEIVCFPGDIRKLTTPKRCLILNTTKSNSGDTLNGNLIWWGGFLRCNSFYSCIMNQNVRSAFWVGTNYDGMWHRNKKESIFQHLWCANSGFVRDELKTWPLHQNKHHVSLFRLQTCRTLNESVLNVSDLKALQ